MSRHSHCAASSSSISARTEPARRDLRLDFFRGLALWLIFVDHVPANVVSWITLRNYGLSDATEIFIFISGYTASLVYGRAWREQGSIFTVARVLRRVWQLYLAHIFLFAVYVAQVSYLSASYDAPIFAQKAQIMSFFRNPDVSIVQALLLNFKPVNLDVLPIYILFLLAFAPALWLLRRAPVLLLCLSGMLYALVCICGWNIPAYPDGLWFFNPLAWQFLFMLGAWCAAGGAERLGRILHARATLCLASTYLVLAFLLAMTWHSAWLAHLEPDWLKQLVIRHPIDKTDLHPLRLLHFLALAAVVARFAPPRWPMLHLPALRPVLLCGRHSLEVFCLGVVLSLAGHFAILELSSTIAMQIVISALGIGAMAALAQLLSWYQTLDAAESPILRGWA
jgi:hypothetical protein